MQDLLSIDWERVGMVAAGLVLFGVAYNRAYSSAMRQGMTSGYVFVWVVGGVLVTIGGVALAGFPVPALMTLALFGASGLPMVVGEMERTATAAQQAQQTKATIARRLSEVTDDEGEAGPLA